MGKKLDLGFVIILPGAYMWIVKGRKELITPRFLY
jgi:hypothetical protein